ncbi:hypothetical protein [Streptosporangium vulgare]|uniref:Uncharacterized protein n=1 Tax=Streptosporangium vulgare TaxID=46190 RepID=A0ABV5TQX5_9ACTN
MTAENPIAEFFGVWLAMLAAGLLWAVVVGWPLARLDLPTWAFNALFLVLVILPFGGVTGIVWQTLGWWP